MGVGYVGQEGRGPMERIAIVNHKGGVGKTTTAVNLAGAWHQLGKRVLIIDCDPQASASYWLLRSRAADSGRGLFEAIRDKKALEPFVVTSASGIDILPAGNQLARFDSAFASGLIEYEALREALNGLPTDRWDYVLLDGAPSLRPLTNATLTASSWLLIPFKVDPQSFPPLAELLEVYDAIVDGPNPVLHILGVVGTDFDTRTKLAPQTLAQCKDAFGEAIFETTVRRNVAVAESFGFFKTIQEYAPRSSGAKDYESLAKEIEARIAFQREATAPQAKAAANHG